VCDDGKKLELIKMISCLACTNAMELVLTACL
jgi:hypothetical protein